jgi:hypothetical protein
MSGKNPDGYSIFDGLFAYVEAHADERLDR